tara:strand:+ start:120351 stop:120890 length:540 start_codon:yes stop_codon:yes gene_type:complete
VFSIIALLLISAGVTGLYFSWRRTGPGKHWVVAGSWLLIALSLGFWSRAWGLEFGIVYSCLALSLCGGLVLLLNYEVRERKQVRPVETQLVVINPRSWGRHIMLLVTVLPVAGAVAVMGSVLMASWLPWQTVNAMVFAVFMIPVVWGLAAYWVCADPMPARPACTLLSVALPLALYLYL